MNFGVRARRCFRSLAVVVVGLLVLATPVALANQISVDSSFGIVDGGDELACVATSQIGALLGKGVKSRPSEWEVATSITEPIDQVVKAWRSGCTWAKPTSPLLAIHVESFAVNSGYTGGGEPWTPSKEVDIFGSLATDPSNPGTGGYITFQRSNLAKRFKIKPVTSNTFAIGDRSTKGQHAAQAIVWGQTSCLIFAVLSNNPKVSALQLAWKAATTPFLGGLA